MTDSLSTTLTWRSISFPRGPLPDTELEILVFDGYLNDTVKASMSMDANDCPVWIDITNDEPLPDPQFWTDVPFPGGDSSHKFCLNCKIIDEIVPSYEKVEIPSSAKAWENTKYDYWQGWNASCQKMVAKMRSVMDSKKLNE